MFCAFIKCVQSDLGSWLKIISKSFFVVEATSVNEFFWKVLWKWAYLADVTKLLSILKTQEVRKIALIVKRIRQKRKRISGKNMSDLIEAVNSWWWDSIISSLWKIQLLLVHRKWTHPRLFAMHRSCQKRQMKPTTMKAPCDGNQLAGLNWDSLRSPNRMQYCARTETVPSRRSMISSQLFRSELILPSAHFNEVPKTLQPKFVDMREEFKALNFLFSQTNQIQVPGYAKKKAEQVSVAGLWIAFHERLEPDCLLLVVFTRYFAFCLSRACHKLFPFSWRLFFKLVFWNADNWINVRSLKVPSANFRSTD